ncbi:MAG: response regulator transcription factor [Acetatifactor sp.]|nr:response regulator transcription factor [Acetatifactor sp.]
MRNILIIEDDIDFAEIVRDMLEGYDYQVSIVNTCETAYEILKTNQFHLILMDINLPDGTGFEVCKELRAVSSVPVIFASARTGEDDKITGLDIGGDDYLAKPYSLKELLARVNALIRRTYGSESEERVYQIHTIRVDVANRTVQKNGAEIKLALKEFDLLAYLCAHPNKAIRKEELLREVWGIFSEAEIATVAVHIRWLREKLEDDPSNPALIRTVWGVGYEFCTLV